MGKNSFCVLVSQKKLDFSRHSLKHFSQTTNGLSIHSVLTLIPLTLGPESPVGPAGPLSPAGPCG